MIQAYQGACHCGRVAFDVRAELTYVVDCTCSVCRRKGVLWHPAADADLRILKGEGGIHPFIRPRLDPSRWAFNVRCIDGVDLASLKVRPFDGQNWEATARAYYDRHASLVHPSALP